MKVKLLKKVRSWAKREVTVYSITMEDGVSTGMRLGYNSDRYKGLFEMGNTEEDVIRKATHIYFENIRGYLEKKYRK